MYALPYGYAQESRTGMVSSPYMGIVSNYDSYNNIPFPYVSCACDPNYELIWCTSQNGFMRGFNAKDLILHCSVEVAQNDCIYSMQSTTLGQITTTELGMNIYSNGGLLRGKIGYELPESGSYRSGYAHIDSGLTTLSLVGDFGGVYTFDLVSGKKKRRAFQEKGSCIYSGQNATTGDVILMDPRMNKCIDSLSFFLCTTQRVLRLGTYIVALGVDYVSKKASLTLPNTAIKVFDARTLDILPYTHLFMQNACSLSEINDENNEFLASDIFGNCCIYSLSNGLNEKNGFSVLGCAEGEIITGTAISSNGSVVCGVSVLGGIHVSANQVNWSVNAHSQPHRIPSLRPQIHFPIDSCGLGGLIPADMPFLSEQTIARRNESRSSNMHMFDNTIIDKPRARITINDTLIDNKGIDGSQKIIKLRKRIQPNSILFGTQHKALLIDVDPRKQHASWARDEMDLKDVKSEIPHELRYKEMRLNHYGFYDIDYGKYNQTDLVGLENNIPNSFLNAVVFMLWTISPLRKLILRHACMDVCCVTCELKFLFRMFDQGRQANAGVCDMI